MRNASEVVREVGVNDTGWPWSSSAPTSTTACAFRPYHRCTTDRDFVPWRFSDAGCQNAWIVSAFRLPKTCTRAVIVCGTSGCHVGSEIDRQPKLSLEVIDRIVFHDWRGDLPDDRRLVGYFSSNRRVERKEQPSRLTRNRIAGRRLLKAKQLRLAGPPARFCGQPRQRPRRSQRGTYGR